MVIIYIGTDFMNQVCHHSVLIAPSVKHRISLERRVFYASIILTWSSRKR